ncbi:MAG TPA: hypothetical protein VEL05_02120 [Candidatus Acidoferrum sp.]|nr:hypothetical protein [Candidatus Acidoferrum sp.]
MAVLTCLAARAGAALACALVAALATGCLAHADASRRTWRELRTRRFTLVTDLEAPFARERAVQLEETGAALAHFYPAPGPMRGPVSPVRVVHLSRCAELREIVDRPVRGFVGSTIDFDFRPLIVTCEDDLFRPTIPIHELTHRFNRRAFASLPAWLDEGLATYYETLRVEGGRAVLGEKPLIDEPYMRSAIQLPTMGELLAMSEEQLIGLGDRRGYFAAWKLVHLLQSGSDDSRRRLDRMLRALASGTNKEDAFAAAFGDVRARLQAEYGLYHFKGSEVVYSLQHENELAVRTLPYLPAAKGAVEGERLLRRGEVHALWIDLASVRSDRAAVLDQLDRLEREDPAWNRRLYWRAVVEHRIGARGTDPVAVLRRYVELQPDDAQGWLALVTLELERVVHAQAGDAAPGAPAAETVERDVQSLVRVATAPNQLAAVGLYYSLRKEPDKGLGFALRAIATDPGCGTCWETLAALYLVDGRVDRAIFAQERAVTLAAERGVPPAMKSRLQIYQQIAAQPGQPEAR